MAGATLRAVSGRRGGSRIRRGPSGGPARRNRSTEPTEDSGAAGRAGMNAPSVRAQFLAADVAVHMDGQQRGRQCRLGLTRPLQNDGRRIAPATSALSMIRPTVDARNWRRLRASTACHWYRVRRLIQGAPAETDEAENEVAGGGGGGTLDHLVPSGLWWQLKSRDHFRSTGVGGVPSPDCPGHG